MTKLELRPNIFVKQFVSRTASTGREMYSVTILINTVGGGQLKLTTLWGDMPYQLPFPVIKRIKNLVTEMVANGWSVENINNVLTARYYSGFPKKQNCSDYERFIKSYNRGKNKPPRLDGYYDLKGRKHGFFHGKFTEKTGLKCPTYSSILGGYVTFFNGTEYVPKYKGYKKTSYFETY